MRTVVAFLYQQVTGSGANQRWETHLQRTVDGSNWDDRTLATTPANSPLSTFEPYLGDYEYLMAVGHDFYGVFCANNTPDNANFPLGVTFQRNADFSTHTLLAANGVTPVNVSIDPFFFQATGQLARPAAVSWDHDRLDIFEVGTDRALYHKAWDGSAWRPSQTSFESLGGIIVGLPTAVSWDHDRLDIFVVGIDRALYHKAWDGSAWRPSQTGWESLGGIADF